MYHCTNIYITSPTRINKINHIPQYFANILTVELFSRKVVTFKRPSSPFYAEEILIQHCWVDRIHSNAI